MSLSSTNRSASTLTATMEASVSLSPRVETSAISAVETVSFSLMTGMAPSCSRRWRVVSTLWRRILSSMSAAVSSTCATVWLYSVNSLS